MWFLWRMLQISWTAKKSNKTVLREADTTRSLINRLCKHRVTSFSQVMRREKLEHLVTTGMIEGKRSKGKQLEKVLDRLTKWLKLEKRVTEATWDRDV